MSPLEHYRHAGVQLSGLPRTSWVNRVRLWIIRVQMAYLTWRMARLMNKASRWVTK